MEEVMPELDILYMTRVQRERFFNEEDYVPLEGHATSSTAAEAGAGASPIWRCCIPCPV